MISYFTLVGDVTVSEDDIMVSHFCQSWYWAHRDECGYLQLVDQYRTEHVRDP